MKLVNLLLIALVFVSSCKEEETDNPTFTKDYGSGMYIATDNGISFYDGEEVKDQIYKKVNGTALQNVNKIKFRGTKLYATTGDKVITANVETLEDKGSVGGFKNAVDFDFVSFDRLFVVDKDDSRVKVVDLASLNITSDIETGNTTNPVFIVSSWYRSIVLNGGLAPDSLRDSTIIAIDNKDAYYPLADFVGSLPVGYNPTAAVWPGNIKVLCKGIYDENNPATNTESSLYDIQPWDFELNGNGIFLSNIYNADNLFSNGNNSVLFFTANGGVYNMYDDGTSINNITDMESDVLHVKTELYAVNDTLNSYTNMIYINNKQYENDVVLKYNMSTGLFCDTIKVSGAVNDINFY